MHLPGSNEGQHLVGRDGLPGSEFFCHACRVRQTDGQIPDRRTSGWPFPRGMMPRRGHAAGTLYLGAPGHDLPRSRGIPRSGVGPSLTAVWRPGWPGAAGWRMERVASCNPGRGFIHSGNSTAYPPTPRSP
jgi:hypothetical protein